MKTRTSYRGNLLVLTNVVISALLLVIVVYSTPSAAQQKQGWTLTFDEEFNESSVDQLFTGGRWCTFAECWSPEGWGLTYDTPAVSWDPIGCGVPKHNNTVLTGNGTLDLVSRKEPGSYTVYRFPNADITKANSTMFVYAQVGDLRVGSPVGDTQHVIPGGTTVVSINPGTKGLFNGLWVQLSNAPSGDATADQLSTLTCVPYNYTGAVLWSQQAFRYGYFEIRAKVPNKGQVLWPAFWLYNGGGSNYREVDIFEFGDISAANNMGMNEHIAVPLDGGVIAKEHHDDGHGTIINDYPENHLITTGGDVTSNFHTYAVKWSPNSVIWYADGSPVRTLAGHSPHLDMYLIEDTAISPWGGNPDALLPANYEIDYVRAYRSQANEFMWQWGNGGSNQIHWWNMNASDRYLAGKFQGNGRDQLLAISYNQWGWSQMMQFNGSSWDTPWGNGGGGKINWWYTHPEDKYVVGDFSAIGRDQLLAINDSDGWVQLMKYDNGSLSWSSPWGNNGNQKIAWWNMNLQDQYIAGDFAGLGYDQVLAIDTANGWAQLLAYYAGDWHTIWGNNGSGQIAGWHISPGDNYLAGDFDGKGRKQLMAIATNQWSWAASLQYSSGNWYGVWDNKGSGKIHWWNMNPTDRYFVGNFDGGKQDQLLAVATNGWSHLMSYSGPDWDTPWGNDGSGTMDLWYMHSSDQYIPGGFNSSGKKDLLAVARNGWVHLIQRRLP